MGRGKAKMAAADLQADTDEVQPDSMTTDQLAAELSEFAPADENGADQTETEKQPTTTSGSNTPDNEAAVKSLLRDVGELGRTKGAGGKALVDLALRVVEGAVKKIIVPEPPKGGESDAERIYKRFRQGESRSSALPGIDGHVGDGLPASATVQISKLKAFIRFGNFWADDALDVMNRALAIHVGLLDDEQVRKAENVPIDRPLKLRSTYSAMNAAATAHLKGEKSTLESVKHGIAMSNEEIESLFTGEPPKDKTALDIVLGALDQCNKAKKGKPVTDNSDGREPVESAYLDAAIEHLREVVNELDPSGETLQAFDAKNKKKEDAAAVTEFKRALRPKQIAHMTH